MAATQNCIICFKKAAGFGGHVHMDGKTIIAGFCKEHFPRTERPPMLEGCNGCYGDWKEEMGVNKSFGEIGYIDRDGFHPLEGEEEDD